ncbi:hypothetical protein FLAG1_10025 [Fusarium langsethiae]|uniref:Uncharacterized protein n=1 Tax=Fusarium langsethiae TaxID=179993 RepID=A0A0M9EPD9_FUSLA|nr:hypothetical protein FLAG1_10025 [Fusarium langsethiae]
MPTATEFWGYSAQNLGPLTTTYSAPSSCATGTDRIVYANASDPVSCPSGWRTVGTLAHDGDDGDKASASGALATPKWDEFVGLNPLHPTEFWLGILEPSETLAFCCPRLVPISTWDGTTLGDNELISFASGTAEPRTSLDNRFLTATAAQEYWAIATYVPAVPLVYTESDKENAVEDNNDDDNDDKDDEGGNNDADDDNAASVTTPRQGFVSVLGITLGLLAGAGMLQ